MKACKNPVAVFSVALALALSALAPVGVARAHDYSELRGLIDKTQSDLREASGLEHGKKQLNRYHDVQDNLSKLDRKLSKGKFDKGALEHSIDELKGIIEHNTLQPSGRDQLRRDLADLQAVRDHRSY
ncbi:MAG TPA: hypothetical protein VK604_07375 [Bryobacteraceae bacterium]|nr:hypothetical protein [Bryobacteraceae bacterium]